MWMHNHSTMATTLLLGEYKRQTRGGPSATSILSRGETLLVRRGEKKTAHRVRVLEAILR